MQGTLYLIPSLLGTSPAGNVLPPFNKQIINNIRYYIVENERSARRFLIKAGLERPIDELTFYVLDKHSGNQSVDTMLLPAESHDIGLISEAGAPGVADPGAEIVARAHQMGIRVVPLTGPSSILLAIMASGLNGQNFAFNGYLPVKSPERERRIRELEKRSSVEKQSQIFIETPYRNNRMMADLVANCRDNTLLCVAADLTMESEWIRTRTIAEWRKIKEQPDKKPAIFIIQAC